MPLVATRSNAGAFGLGWSAVIPFSPADLSPVLWLDASNTSTITESGGAVSQWDNLGSAGNFTQGTAAYQPTTGASTLNGLNVIDFAGDYFTSADAASAYKFMHDGTTFLLCMVAKHNGTSKGYLGNNANTTADTGFAYYSTVTNTNISTFISDSSGDPTTIPVFSTVSSAVVNNTFTIHTALFDPDNGTAANRAELFFDNGSGNKTNTNTATVSTSNPTRVLQIGASGNNVFPFTGSFAEIVILSGANATELNRQRLLTYLNNKWSVY